MASFNKVILVGNLTRDPELRYTPKGMAIAQIGLAINRNWTTESGEKKEEVTFVDVTAFGRTAETISQYYRKGGSILIEGRLQLDQWDDKQTGQKRSKLKVICESFQFMGKNASGEGGDADGLDHQARPTRPPSRSPQEAREAARKEATASDGPPPDDDVPF